ncbi:MAG TPA: bifunctional phosphopantothenoylcysteine decarboxylase/phosphopantothenate--cysteine ligase CoaBC [Anaerolineales bacterium]|nr:bifunctional phosphopantothenoylcysteine decarboxylase/phosphopantothenate--cysteine ligase CoaBC [Anaerolineales bacterium]
MNPPTIPLLLDRRILLGVTGSIAAYKAADLASKLAQAGARVDVILTEAAERFVSALTFQSVTGRRAFRETDLWGSEAHVLHVGLGASADLLVVAPATANTIAKLAHGAADSLITVTALAARCPLLLAPAMDAGMFEHPATQANLELLRQRGAVVIGPAEGRMASGQVGLGRMVEPAELLGHVRLALGRSGSLAGRTVVVTAAGTQEPLDPVRSITNRSSGKQGFALAQAALDRGAAVTLIAGTTHLEPPVGAHHVEALTASAMQAAVHSRIGDADVLLMAAAVADFRPTLTNTQKIKRAKGVGDLHLEPTEDILAEVAAVRKRSGRPQVVVGFAAESQDMVANAIAKLEAKGLSLIVANDITSPDAGFAVDDNRVTLIDAEGAIQELPLMSKAQVAEVVLERVERLLSVEEG